jgi:hypothetical protein
VPTLHPAPVREHQDVWKLKTIAHRARIGSSLERLAKFIGTGVKTARPDFFQSEDIKRLWYRDGPMKVIALPAGKPIRH